MRIAIDASPLTVATGGIRRYVLELTRALAQEFPQDEVHLLAAHPVVEVPAELLGRDNVTVGTGSRPWWRRKWWSLGLPRELARRRIDIFHGADFAIPYLPVCPSVLVVHDLSPWKTGRLRAGGAQRIRRRTPYLLRLASRIVTPSEAVREELSGFFAIPRSRIVAIPLAAAPEFCAVEEGIISEQLPRMGIERPYLLFVGARNRRKNLPGLLEAWAVVRRRHPALSLVLAGPPGDAEIDNSEERGLRICGPLPDKEIQILLSGALAFVYPSLYEGFGLPVLEAMKAGVPVITSNDSAIGEVAAGAAVQVDVTAAGQLSRAILEVVESDGLRARLREQGGRRASQFSWRSTASMTRAVYVEAIRRF